MIQPSISSSSSPSSLSSLSSPPNPSPAPRPSARTTRAALLIGAITLTLGACAQPAPPPPPASEGFSAGISMDARADGIDLETPLYPGAVPYKDRDDDKPDAGGQLYKVGLPKNFRVVSVKPLPDGTTQISVARVRFR